MIISIIINVMGCCMSVGNRIEYDIEWAMGKTIGNRMGHVIV